MTKPHHFSCKTTQLKSYPKPGPVGGGLLRKLVRQLKDSGVELPIEAREVVIAVSGGLDSMALAEALLVYGRRVLGESAQVRVLHLDHGWRTHEAEHERNRVEAACRERWGGVPFDFVRLRSPRSEEGRVGERVSWEAFSRKERLDAFDLYLKRGAWVLTGHHADDQVETLFWRFMRGEWETHREGVLGFFPREQGAVIRPLLGVWKEELFAFAKEQGLVWSEDQTNQDTERMRAALRLNVFPQLGKIFPGFQKRLLRYAKPQPD